MEPGNEVYTAVLLLYNLYSVPHVTRESLEPTPD